MDSLAINVPDAASNIALSRRGIPATVTIARLAQFQRFDYVANSGNFCPQSLSRFLDGAPAAPIVLPAGEGRTHPDRMPLPDIWPKIGPGKWF